MRIEDVITDLGGDRGAMGRRLVALSDASRGGVYLYTCHGSEEQGHSWIRDSNGAVRQISHHVPILRRLGVREVEDLAPPYEHRSLESIQTQGEASLRHEGGWTTLAWWDRSVRRQYGSMTALIVPEPRLSFESMVRILRQRFPAVWGRQPVPLCLSSDPSGALKEAAP